MKSNSSNAGLTLVRGGRSSSSSYCYALWKIKSRQNRPCARLTVLLVLPTTRGLPQRVACQQAAVNSLW